jgi:hypothetical protein
MRAWGNRPDTFVCDEPLYAHYLVVTGKDHPGAQEVIARHEPDWRKVVYRLTTFEPPGKRVFYQKHMAHHLVGRLERDWLGKLTHCFLIRRPSEVIVSYIKKNPDPLVEDLGFIQQREIFEWVRRHLGVTPPVLDSHDVLEEPRRFLGLLCDAIRVDFSDAMLSWAPGLRDTDGVWAKYWYHEVATSTGFRPNITKNELVPERLKAVYDECLIAYDALYEHRLR